MKSSCLEIEIGIAPTRIRASNMTEINHNAETKKRLFKYLIIQPSTKKDCHDCAQEIYRRRGCDYQVRQCVEQAKRRSRVQTEVRVHT
jgi:hypothetical protein